MRMIVMALVACVCLSTGCKPSLLPSQEEAHRLAANADVDVWVRRPDGKLEKVRVKFQPGDYCATAKAMDTVPSGEFKE
jgi:hypothetical protein